MKIKKCLTLFLALALVLGSTGGWSARAEEAEDSALAPTLSETAGTAAAVPATPETQPVGEPAFLSHMAGEQFAQADHVARLAGEERLDTYVYLNRDGTKSVYYMGRNVKFVDADGIVREKDTTLVSADGGYTMRQNDVNLLLPHNPADGVLMAAGGGGVRLVPQGGSGSAVLEDNAVLYEDYYGQGMSLKYTPMLDGVKEDIILESYSGVSSFSFGLAANGLRLYERNGRWCLAQNATAEAAFLLGEILVYDAVGKPAAGTLTVQEVRTGVYTLTVSAPVAYLTDPTTVYPVTIDPTITSKDTMSTSNIEDATVFSGYPNNNFGNYVFNTIGYQDASYGTGRVAVRLKGLLNDATYQSLSADHIVSVQFYMKDGGSNYAYVNIHALTGNSTWTESTVKNSNVGTASETVYDSQRMGGGKWATFDLTDLAKDWKNGNRNGQCGFLMVIADSTKKIGALSCEYGSGDYWPYVVVNYAVSSVLNYTVKDINKGSSFALTADTGGVAAEITWTSSNTGVATVSSSGVVTGVNAGKAVITASSDVFTEPVSCIVYVTVQDGVYFIEHSGMRLAVENEGITNGTGVTQYGAVADEDEILAHKWKIKYIGNGYYSIRPMHKLNMGLDVSGGWVDVWNIGTSDTYSGVAEYALWEILGTTNGYIFVNNYENDTDTNNAMRPNGGTSASGAAICVDTLDATSSAFLWTLSDCSVYTDAIIYDCGKASESARKGVMPGQTRTLSDMGIEAAFVSATKISQTVSQWYSSNTAVATVNATTGSVTGVANGTAAITAKYTQDGVQYLASFTIAVYALPLSGYELDYEPELWNNSAVQWKTNCYAYVLNNQIDPNGNAFGCTAFKDHKQQPGGFYNAYTSGDPISIDGYYLNPDILIDAVKKDYEMYNEIFGRNLIFTEIGRDDVCPAGTYKVMLTIKQPDWPNGADYHWYRQNSDGTWSHKRGLTVVKCVDDAETPVVITDPGNINLAGYTFVGYFALSPWNHYYTPTSSAQVSSQEFLVTQGVGVSGMTVDDIVIGMTIQDVLAILGENVEDIGSGVYIHRYISEDNQLVIISYEQDAEGVYRVSNIYRGTAE